MMITENYLSFMELITHGRINTVLILPWGINTELIPLGELILF